jgi:peptidoglycan/LPS O-acetylase OafA/YrhL
MPKNVRLPGLEAARFYAASMILLFHFVHLSKVEVPGYLGFIATHFGFGVPLFYVVSAFGLSLGYHDKLGSREGMKDYYMRRFLRIAPLFYFMMLFYIPYRALLGGAYPSLGEFISSGLFIFNFIPQHVTGFVAASWSVGVEMAFYFIFPLLILAITSWWRALVFLAAATFVGLFWTAAFVGAPAPLKTFGSFFLIAHLHYFAAGMLAYFVWAKLVDHPARPWLGELLITLASVTILCLYSRHVALAIGPIVGWENWPTINQVGWSLALATFVIGISISPVPHLVNNVTLQLGKASFSIYLWHPVVISVLIKTGAYVAIYAVVGAALPSFLLCTALTFLIVCPLSLASYRWIEVPGIRLHSTSTKYLRRWSARGDVSFDTA